MTHWFQFFVFVILLFPEKEKYVYDTSVNMVYLRDAQSFEKKFSGYKLPQYFQE